MNAPRKPNIGAPTAQPDDQTFHAGRCDNALKSHRVILTLSPKRAAQHVTQPLTARYAIGAAVYFGGQQKPLFLTGKANPPFGGPDASSVGLVCSIRATPLGD